MLLLLSPAKIQNFKPQQITTKQSLPQFMEEAESLMQEVRQLTDTEFARLLGVNMKLAELNVQRHAHWQLPFTANNAKQVVFTYDGEVFRGLNPTAFSAEELDYLQSHLRIFSGLYGMLRPLDFIQAYRLEISTKLMMHGSTDLYKFWGDKFTDTLNELLDNSPEERIVLNLSSNEYFKSINRKKLQARVIDFEFLECVDGKYKAIVVYIKKARGMMVRYVVENRIENAEDLKGFSADGYWYNEGMSSERKFVFTRG